jgi:hypothetical protein
MDSFMNRKFLYSLGIIAILAVLAAVTLDGPIRIATLILLAGFGLKMCLVVLRNKMD